MKCHHTLACAAALTLTILAGACAKPEDEKRAEEVAQAAEEGAKSIEDSAAQAAKGLEAMAKGLGAMAGNAVGGAPVPPVSFRDLQTVFPELDGWQRGKPTGERMSQPVSFSQAEVEYTNGDKRLKLKIVDSGFNQMLMAPYAMFLSAGYEKETEDGYEKSATVAGNPGWEKWNESSKDGELNALVAKRFLVTIEGDDIDDTKVLHELAQKSDLGKLAGMK